MQNAGTPPSLCYISTPDFPRKNLMFPLIFGMRLMKSRFREGKIRLAATSRKEGKYVRPDFLSLNRQLSLHSLPRLQRGEPKEKPRDDEPRWLQGCQVEKMPRSGPKKGQPLKKCQVTRIMPIFLLFIVFLVEKMQHILTKRANIF